MRIFLVGFMGCGKTTLGSKLANMLQYDFIDLDKLIEERTGKTIAEYFKLFGETAFRAFERDALQSSTFPDKVVISTGGGAPCFFDNMDWMNQHGITIYISMSPKALANRLKHSKGERPLIAGQTEEELISFIAHKLEEREFFYRKAKYILSGVDLAADKIVQLLV
jgi:shikimate kinase